MPLQDLSEQIGPTIEIQDSESDQQNRSEMTPKLKNELDLKLDASASITNAQNEPIVPDFV